MAKRKEETFTWTITLTREERDAVMGGLIAMKAEYHGDDPDGAPEPSALDRAYTKLLDADVRLVR